MPVGDAVHEPAEMEGEPRHVQRLAPGDETQLVGLDIAAQDPLDHLVGEAVVTGLDRRVRREDAHVPYAADLVFELARADLVLRPREAAQEIEGKEGGMALVQVIAADVEAERLQNAQAADPEHDLLLEAIDLIATIELVGQAAVGLGVLVKVGVQEQHGYGLADRAAQKMQPRPHPNLAAFQEHGDLGPERGCESFGIPRIGMLDLLARCRDLLSQVAASADQRHEHRRDAEIGARSRRVTGEDAQTAAIGVHLRTGCDFHREIRNARAGQKRSDRGHRAFGRGSGSGGSRIRAENGIHDVRLGSFGPDGARGAWRQLSAVRVKVMPAEGSRIYKVAPAEANQTGVEGRVSPQS
jgi:hypothetical protein